MAKTEWRTVRVSALTLDMLEQLRGGMLLDQERAANPLGSESTRSGKEDTRDRIGLDQVIRALVLWRLKQRQRKRESASRLRGIAEGKVNCPTTEGG